MTRKLTPEQQAAISARLDRIKAGIEAYLEKIHSEPHRAHCLDPAAVHPGLRPTEEPRQPKRLNP